MTDIELYSSPTLKCSVRRHWNVMSADLMFQCPYNEVETTGLDYRIRLQARGNSQLQIPPPSNCNFLPNIPAEFPLKKYSRRISHNKVFHSSWQVLWLPVAWFLHVHECLFKADTAHAPKQGQGSITAYKQLSFICYICHLFVTHKGLWLCECV